MVAMLLDAPPPLGFESYDRSSKSILRHMAKLDWCGATLTLGAITSLILGLQWGGDEKAWNSQTSLLYETRVSRTREWTVD